MILRLNNLNSRWQFGYLYLGFGFYMTTDPIGWLLGLCNRITWTYFKWQEERGSKHRYYWTNLRRERAEYHWHLYKPAVRAHRLFEWFLDKYLRWDRFYRCERHIPYFFDRIERRRHT